MSKSLFYKGFYIMINKMINNSGLWKGNKNKHLGGFLLHVSNVSDYFSK